MKKYNLLALAACLWMTTACSDFLELNESGYNSVEYQFSTFDRTKAVATNVYGYLKDGYSEVCSTMIDAATDDAVNAWSTNGIKGFYDGSWNTSAPIGDVWEYYYRAIAAANYFIEHCPADFPAAKYQEKYEEKLKELKLYPYEIQALRAYFHFELLKRYKNIIIADRQFTLEEVNELQPATFAEAVNWIVGECDEAAKFLPVTFKGMTSTDEVGRATKGMALALKARVLLYAASPLNSTDNQAKWLKAAKAAKAVIDLNVYQEKPGEEVINNPNSLDFIFGRWNGVSNSFESANFPIGYEGGNSGVCPSHNLVEAFDMRDGTPFDWNNPEHRNKALEPSESDPAPPFRRNHRPGLPQNRTAGRDPDRRVRQALATELARRRDAKPVPEHAQTLLRCVEDYGQGYTLRPTDRRDQVREGKRLQRPQQSGRYIHAGALRRHLRHHGNGAAYAFR